MNNTGTISSMVIGLDSTIDVSNTGIISKVYIESVEMWYFYAEANAIKDFQNKYTVGSYKNYEYATYTFATNIFGDGTMYYGYDTPITIKWDNMSIPAFWNNSRAISYMHTHPGSGKNLNPSGMDKLFAEVAGRPYYVVTNMGNKPYVPQYGGDAEKILKNIGPEIGVDAWDWINYYWNKI